MDKAIKIGFFIIFWTLTGIIAYAIFGGSFTEQTPPPQVAATSSSITAPSSDNKEDALPPQIVTTTNTSHQTPFQVSIENSEAQSIDYVVDSTNPITTKGIELFYTLNFRDSQNELIKNKNDQTAQFYLGLIASYEDRISDSKNWLEKAQNSEKEYIKNSSQEILAALEEFAGYRDGKRDFLATLLGKAYLNIGQITLSIYKLTEATQMTPNYEAAWKLLGVALIAAKQYPQAKEALSKIEANNDPEILYFEGVASFNANDFSNSIIAFQKAKKAGYEDNETINRYLADSLLAEEKYESAQKLYVKLIQTSPKDITLYEKAIFISLSVLNDTKTAFTIAKKAIANNSQSHLSHYYIALVAFKKNDFKTARTYINSSLKINNEYAPAYFLSGELYEIKENIKAANTEYKKIIKLNNDDEYAEKAKIKIKALENNSTTE